MDYEVNETGPYTFELKGIDMSGHEQAITYWYITQDKHPVTLEFTEYRKALEEPGELMLSDFAKFDRPPLLHLAYKALAEYWESHDGQYPTPGNVEQAKQVYDIAKSMDSDKLLEEDVEKKQRIVMLLASGASTFNTLIESCIKFGLVNADATKNERGRPLSL